MDLKILCLIGAGCGILGGLINVFHKEYKVSGWCFLSTLWAVAAFLSQ